jgi:hypothetical protein
MLDGRMRSSLRRASTLWIWFTAGAGVAVACTFPDYLPPSDAITMSGQGQGGSNPPAGSSGTSAVGGTSGAQASGGNVTGGTSVLGDAGNGGEAEVIEPVPVDLGPCGEQRPHPTHCWNKKQDMDETDVDCGGPRCAQCAAEEACLATRDCSAGTCVNGKCARLFSLTYMQLMPDEETASFRFKTVLSYAGKEPVLLRDVAVRYYFSRNSVVEPILPDGTTLQLPDQGDISPSTVWTIGRQLRGNGITNDAYLEIGFTGGKILTEGQSLELSASATSGDGKSLFNQKTHYSFDSPSTLHDSKKLTVYYKGDRAWGDAPVIDDPPTCYRLGVNLDGPAVTVDGNEWLLSPDSVLDRYLNDLVVMKPNTDKGHHDMLRAGFFLHGDTFSYPVENGTYALLAYAWSADGAETGSFKAQGETLDAFHATSFAGGGPWVALGPYRVTVSDGQLKLGAQGDLRLGGIELRLLDE